MDNTVIYLLISTLWSAGIAGIVSFYWIGRFRKEVIRRIENLHLEFIDKLPKGTSDLRPLNESVKNLAENMNIIGERFNK